jgi:hypothetical protein
MVQKKAIKVLTATSVKLFKIRNRRGYAALCKENLTEGQTPYQAYQRMNKALKRQGFVLKEIDAKRAQKLIRKSI